MVTLRLFVSLEPLIAVTNMWFSPGRRGRRQVESTIARLSVLVVEQGDPAQARVDLMSQVQRCSRLEVPLTFTPEQIGVLGERFRYLWRPYLYRVFAETTPYRTLWEYGKAHGFHSPPVVNLYAAKFIFVGDEAEKRAERIVNEIKIDNPLWSFEADFEVPRKHIDSQIKNDSWAFKVVFQKALFASFVGLLRQAEVFVGSVSDAAEQRSKFTTMWIEAINRLFELPLAGVLAGGASSKERFWVGIGLKSDETIDFTQGGTKRIAQWLNAWVCLYWLRPEVPTFGELGGDSRRLAEIAQNALTLRVTMEGMIRLARAQGVPEAEEEDAAMKLTRDRYHHLRKLLLQ